MKSAVKRFLFTGCIFTLAMICFFVGTQDSWRPSERASSKPLIKNLQECTSIGLVQDGAILHGANIEHETINAGLIFVNPRGMEKWGLDESTDGAVARWVSKYGSVTFNLVGYQYVSNGMNEAGLTVSSMSLRTSVGPEPDERPPLDESLWVQYQLDNHSTVTEVIASQEKVRVVADGSHHLFCDRTGDCAVIEFINGQMVATRGKDLPVIVVTNTAYQEALEAWKKNMLLDGSLRRFSKAARRVGAFDPEKEDGINYLFDTLAQITLSSVRTPPAQWSMVFDLRNFVIHYRTLLNPDIRSIDFGELDFACNGPSRMLDVHAGEAGDVSAQFRPYSHDRSLAHFTHFLDAWGIEATDDGATAFYAELERYNCVEGQTARPEIPSLVEIKANHAGEFRSWWIFLAIPVVSLVVMMATWRMMRMRQSMSELD